MNTYYHAIDTVHVSGRKSNRPSFWMNSVLYEYNNKHAPTKIIIYLKLIYTDDVILNTFSV